MIVHFGTVLMHAEWPGSTVCIGVFDGVHLGHQHVIQAALRKAGENQQPCVLVTFDRNPVAVLAPERTPLAIASLSQNLDAFESAGVSVAVVLTFDEQMAATTAKDFLDEILLAKLKAEHLVVGHDFALGKGREGNGGWLQDRIDTTIVPPFEMDSQRVSSSDVRRLVSAGEVERANVFLGRPFELQGVVVAGEKLGRTIGYPTVNLALGSTQCVPRDGVYGGWCTTIYGKFLAAISVGMRPTVHGTERTIEAYLIDYPGKELYGSVIHLGFSMRVRDEVAFANLDELRAAIANDVTQIRSKLA